MLPSRALPVAAAFLFLAASLVAHPAHAQDFGPRLDLDTGPVPRDVAVGDIDEDGRLDIAVAVQGQGVVSIFYGNGDLTFRPRVDIGVRPVPLALALVDWTGDANLDLLVGAVSDTSLTVYAGDGAGGFVEGASVKCPTVPYEIETADVSGDGRLDAIVAADEFTVALFDVAGTAGGGFGVPRVLVAASGDRSRSIAVGQIDGQFGPDIYFGSTQGLSQVLRHDGAGGFQAPVLVAGSGVAAGVALGDFDGDAHLDAIEVGTGTSSGLRLLRGTGTGGFALAQSFGVGSNPSSPVVADLNRDGPNDVAFLAGNGTQVNVSLFGCTLDPPAFANVDITASDLALGDFDTDGDLDYVSSNQGGASVSVRRNDGGVASCSAYPAASPTSLDFGLAPVGLVQSTPLRIENLGDAAFLLLGASVATAAFEHDPVPVASILPGGHVTFLVRTLRPVLGVMEDTLVVATSSAEVPFLRIPLRAEGRVGTPAAPSVVEPSLHFADGAQGFPAGLSATVLNLGETGFHITGATVDGSEFSVGGSFPIPVGPIAAHPLTVTCLHATLGSTSDTLRITTDVPSTPVLLVPLTATTRLPAPALLLTPTSLAFPQGVQGFPDTQPFEARNTGEIDLVLSAPQFGTAEFAVVDAYPVVIAPGQTRNLSVRQQHVALGHVADTLRLATNVPGLPQALLPLSGTTVVGNPVPTWSGQLNFGSDIVGTGQTLATFLGNSGNAAYTVQSASVNTSEYTVLTPLPVVVAAGALVPIQVRYNRLIAGSAVDTLRLVTNTQTAPTIRLLGFALTAVPSGELVDTLMSFGVLPVGGVSEITALVRSTGIGPLIITSIAVSSPDLTVLTPVPVVVSSGATAPVRVRFRPTTPGPFTDEVLIETDMAGGPVLVLTVTADVRQPPVVNLVPEIIAPVELAHGASTSVPLLLRNLGTEWPLTGTATVRIDSVRTATVGPPIVSGPRQVRFDGEGHEWDIEPDGSIATGDTAAFAGGLDWFTFTPVTSSVLRDGGRTIQLGPVIVGTRELTRSVHVPLSGAWIRYVDTVRNRTNAPLSYHVFIQSTVAADPGFIARTSSGGLTLRPQLDDWAVVADQAGPAIGHVFAGPGAQRPSAASFGSGTSQGLAYTYLLQLPPQASASIVHFALQAPTLAEGMARAESLHTFGDGALTGLTALERSRIVNFNVPKAISIPPTSFGLAPLGSLARAIGFDARVVSDEEAVFGSLRVATDDPVRPLVVVPLELRILGTPDVIGVGPDGPGFVLAARFLPNPAGARGVRLSYALPAAGDARFDLYDVRGRRLASRTLVAAPAGPGWLDWTGRAADGGSGLALAPGVYWTRLTHAGKSVITKGVVLN